MRPQTSYIGSMRPSGLSALRLDLDQPQDEQRTCEHRHKAFARPVSGLTAVSVWLGVPKPRQAGTTVLMACSRPMEETMTLTYRSMTFAACFAALIAASASAGAQPTYKHKTHTQYTAMVVDPAPAVATVLHGRGAPTETDGLSRNSDDCNFGCIDH